MIVFSRSRLATVLLAFGFVFADIAPSSHSFLFIRSYAGNKSRLHFPQLCICGETSQSSVILNSRSSNDDDDDDVLGVGTRGITLFCVVAVFNIWLFSIPTEFRRAKFCSAEQVRLYPDSKCMTSEMWIGGIKEYYANGGGLKFDFSIEGRGDE